MQNKATWSENCITSSGYDDNRKFQVTDVKTYLTVLTLSKLLQQLKLRKG